MKVVNDFVDYQIIDASCGMKLEMWKDVCLFRPDPLVMWDNGNLESKYKGKINSKYIRSNTGGGHWENLRKTPERWVISYRDMNFNIKQMGFKHTGVFPEQAYNWNYVRDVIKKCGRKVKVLNLFAYTGGATLACMKEGAHVTHVDSSRGMIDWAKENLSINDVDSNNVRFIVDDVVKFCEREVRRGNSYDIIIMDPPSFGRGANGETWKIEDDLFKLLKICKNLISNEPLLFLVNSYSGLSPMLIENMLNLTINNDKVGKVSSDEIGLLIKDSDLILPCGIMARVDYE